MTKTDALINLISEGSHDKLSKAATLLACRSLEALDIRGKDAKRVLLYLELIDNADVSRPTDETTQARVDALIKG